MTEDDPLGKRSENRIETLYGVSRRTIMKAAGVVALGGGALTGTAAAAQHEDDDDDVDIDDEYGDVEDEEPEVDEPDGFEVDVIAPHAPFPDELAATFDLTFADDSDECPIVVELDDASTVIVAEVTWTEGGTSGWHRHPGVVIVNVVEGEIEVTWEHDCVPRTYSAGESFFDPGEIHIADSDDGAVAYATFLGIPDGEPATEWVEPVDC
ncbi:cupin domain-containing protein [Halalkalicoccus ordinarius]|uniref:cupin domain-containing protein n=1 Tax=Halalkalicoccus ordinarius TaxID=3116651 RepID=UPI00300F4EFE